MKNVCSTLLLVLITVSYAHAQSSSTQKPSFIFSAHGGLGYRIGNSSSGLAQGLEDHVNALRSGIALNVEAGMHINPNNAITLSWGMFSRCNNSGNFITSLENGTSASTRVNTKDMVNAYMVNWLTYTNIGGSDKARLFGQAGIGMASYRSANDFFFEGIKAPATLTGTGFASNVGAGIDLKMSRNLFLTGQLNYFMAGVTIKSEDGIALDGIDEKEKLNQLRLTVGVRYRL
jgi:hypothetical protein